MVAITREPGTTYLLDKENMAETLFAAIDPVVTNMRPCVASSDPLGEPVVRTTLFAGCGASDHGFEYSAVDATAAYEVNA